MIEVGPTRDILFAGMPSTGKTTYLALLYLAIIEGRAGDLALGTYQDDREYLNRISERLQRCELPVHTEVAEREELALSLVVGPQRVPTLLRIPDTSGETWEAACTERHIPPDLDERARATDAILLFTHPSEDFDAGVSIVDANAADKALLGESPPLSGEFAALKRSPTQVELVDLLQILRESRGPRPAMAAIMVSAYDLVASGIAPQDWLSRNLPLLAQYIDVNRDWLKVEVFGVSAQGGAFDDAVTVSGLLEVEPLDRALVLGGDGSAVSAEAPILWAMTNDG